MLCIWTVSQWNHSDTASGRLSSHDWQSRAAVKSRYQDSRILRGGPVKSKNKTCTVLRLLRHARAALAGKSCAARPRSGGTTCTLYVKAITSDKTRHPAVSEALGRDLGYLSRQAASLTPGGHGRELRLLTLHHAHTGATPVSDWAWCPHSSTVVSGHGNFWTGAFPTDFDRCFAQSLPIHVAQSLISSLRRFRHEGQVRSDKSK